MMFAGNSVRALALGAGVLSMAACMADEDGGSVAKTSQASTFNWGSDCSSGEGSFQQFIPKNVTSEVGVIPVGKRNVAITLNSPADVDVQLIEKSTGTKIIAWPTALLNGPTFECATYKGVEYCYSGYNGVDGQLGHETIEVRGDTNIELEMKAFGYAAGDANVTYSWQPLPTCNEKGSGSFSTTLSQGAVDLIGDIPVNKIGVEILLDSSQDLDIQLFDGEVALVKWPDGQLSGPGQQELQHNGMKITWSGYNGTNGSWGNEYIRIEGRVSSKLTMKAFAYASGSADVTYEWGIGAGDVCGTLGAGGCDDGYVCKNGNDGNIAVDKPGSCHNEFWCESQASVDPTGETGVLGDCHGLIHPATPGTWACENFTCKWAKACSLANQDCGSSHECQIGCPTGENCGINPPGVCVALQTCSLANQTCPSGYQCQIGCPTPGNCGINPPGVCQPL